MLQDVAMIIIIIIRGCNTISLDDSITAADRWRVILKGEQPDYIHAVNVNVSVDVMIDN